QMLLKHMEEALQPGGAGVGTVVWAWLRALTSIASARVNGRTKIPPEFDEVTYLSLHPDVMEEVAVGRFSSGYEHWIRVGREEGRPGYFRKPDSKQSTEGTVRPHANVPPDFDEDAYLFLNPDVAAAVNHGAFPSGYAHWSRIGRFEGRGGGCWEA